MYMTRMRLDTTNRQTMRALAEPKLFHGAVERSFSGERRRNLWRIDRVAGGFCLMIVSPDKPDLSAAAAQFGFPSDEPAWETRDYEPLLNRVQAGSRWHFRLAANPTTHGSGSASQGMRGKVMPHISAQFQQKWLMDKAAQHGFALDEDDFCAVGQQWFRFRKGGEAGAPVSLLCVTFEGMLTVTDEVLFRKALSEGIGRAKAYGMGMLTIVRPEAMR